MPTLTSRERILLALLVQDKCNKEIAKELGLSMSNVGISLHLLFRKLGVRSRVGAAIFAVQNNLTTLTKIM